MQPIVVGYMFEYVGVIHDWDLDKLSFLRIVHVCEKLLAVNDPFQFRLLVMENNNDVVHVVGLALVEKHLVVIFNKKDNKIIDQYTLVILEMVVKWRERIPKLFKILKV